LNNGFIKTSETHFMQRRADFEVLLDRLWNTYNNLRDKDRYRVNGNLLSFTGSVMLAGKMLVEGTIDPQLFKIPAYTGYDLLIGLAAFGSASNWLLHVGEVIRERSYFSRRSLGEQPVINFASE
jgi:hypothetical protein